jgi:hypothetical protein
VVGTSGYYWSITLSGKDAKSIGIWISGTATAMALSKRADELFVVLRIDDLVETNQSCKEKIIYAI